MELDFINFEHYATMIPSRKDRIRIHGEQLGSFDHYIGSASLAGENVFPAPLSI